MTKTEKIFKSVFDRFLVINKQKNLLKNDNKQEVEIIDSQVHSFEKSFFRKAVFKIYLEIENASKYKISVSNKEMKGVFDFLDEKKLKLQSLSCVFKVTEKKSFKTPIAENEFELQEHYYNLNPNCSVTLVEFYMSGNVTLMENALEIIINAQNYTKQKLVYKFRLIEPQTNDVYGPKIPILSIPYVTKTKIQYSFYCIQLEFWVYVIIRVYIIDINTRSFFK